MQGMRKQKKNMYREIKTKRGRQKIRKNRNDLKSQKGNVSKYLSCEIYSLDDKRMKHACTLNEPPLLLLVLCFFFFFLFEKVAVINTFLSNFFIRVFLIVEKKKYQTSYAKKSKLRKLIDKLIKQKRELPREENRRQ